MKYIEDITGGNKTYYFHAYFPKKEKEYTLEDFQNMADYVNEQLKNIELKKKE